MNPKSILFTGTPGCGKSTLIEEIVSRTNSPAVGFFTREINKHGHWVGFFINSLNGQAGMLAHQMSFRRVSQVPFPRPSRW